MSKSNENEVIRNKYLKQIKSIEVKIINYSSILSDKIMTFFIEKLCIFYLRNKTYEDIFYEYPIANRIRYYTDLDDYNNEWNHKYEMNHMQSIFQDGHNSHELSYDEDTRLYSYKSILIKKRLSYLLSLLGEKKKKKITRRELDQYVVKYLEKCQSLTNISSNDLEIIIAVFSFVTIFLG